MGLTNMRNQLDQLINQHRHPSRYCPMPAHITSMAEALGRLECYTERLTTWQNAIPAYDIEKQSLELQYPFLLYRAPIGPDGRRNHRADMRPIPPYMSKDDWNEICTRYRSVCNQITTAHIKIEQYENWIAQAIQLWHNAINDEGRGGVTKGVKSA